MCTEVGETFIAARWSSMQVEDGCSEAGSKEKGRNMTRTRGGGEGGRRKRNASSRATTKRRRKNQTPAVQAPNADS